MATRRARLFKSLKGEKEAASPNDAPKGKEENVSLPATPPHPRHARPIKVSSASATPPLVLISEPESTPREGPPRLPGLHISGEDLAAGLEFAAREWSQGARELLLAANKAYKTLYPDRLCHDLPEAAEALRNGSWVPSLRDLLAAGLTSAALRFMPKGTVEVEIPEGTIQVGTQELGEELAKLASLVPEERRQIVEAVQMLLGVFPGATVERWA